MRDTMQTYRRWRNWPALPGGLQKELALLERDPEARRDAFYRDLSFGTGGMRGVMGAGTNRINVPVIRRAARGVGDWLNRAGTGSSGVVVAYDTRHLSHEFAKETALALCAAGVPVYLYDRPVPTPQLSFSVPYLAAAAGIVITASHNPGIYNGFKVYDARGCQLLPDAAAELTDCIRSAGDPLEIPVQKEEEALRQGLLRPIGEAESAAYRRRVAGAVQPGGCRGITVVYSPLHGAGAVSVPRVLRDRGASVLPVTGQTDPDGDFPTVSAPNPERPDALRMGLDVAEETGADLVLATDADCDRVGAAVRCSDGIYRSLNGNDIGALLLDFLLQTAPPEQDAAVITTLVSGRLGAAIARAHGLEVHETLTGFKYIGDFACRLSAAGTPAFYFGYEESYGYLAGTHARDKDAVEACLLLCAAAARLKRAGSDLHRQLTTLRQTYGFYLEQLESAAYPGEAGCAHVAHIMRGLREGGAERLPGIVQVEDFLRAPQQADLLRMHFADGSRLSVRPSGTEPFLKCYADVCGTSDEDAAGRLRRVCALARQILEKGDASCT